MTQLAELARLIRSKNAGPFELTFAVIFKDRATYEKVRDAKIINALWFGNPHPTHFNVEEALEAAGAVGAARTFLIHLTHRLGHADLASRLPAGVEPAYDGLIVEV